MTFIYFSYHLSDFFVWILFYIAVQLINNVMLVSGVQQNDSVFYIYIYVYVRIHTHTCIYMYIQQYIYCFSILAWRIPWTIPSMGSQRVGHDWVTFTFTFMLKSNPAKTCHKLDKRLTFCVLVMGLQVPLHRAWCALCKGISLCENFSLV